MEKDAGKVPVLNQVLEDVQHLRMQQRRCGVLASRRGAGKDKNSRADNRADSKSGERPRPQRFRQPMPRPFRVRNQLVNGLLGKELAGQKGLLKNERLKVVVPGKTAMRRRSAPGAPLRRHQYLALGCAAGHLLHLGLLGAARVRARLCESGWRRS